MHQSINKQKIYFYLLILIFLTTIFNFQFLNNLNKFYNLKKIDIYGLNESDRKLLEKELNKLLNKNIFLISKIEILTKLNNFKFIDQISIKKILPSKLMISAKKTNFLGVTFLDGTKYFVGSNGKYIYYKKADDDGNLPLIFGNFQISDFLKLIEILKNLNFDTSIIEKYYHHKSKRWDLKYKNGLIIKLPSNNIINALETYKNFINIEKINETKIVDLRIINQVILSNEKK